MQRNDFRILNKVIFTDWNYLQSRVMPFCFSVIKRYIFHYFMKLTPIPGNQSFF